MKICLVVDDSEVVRKVARKILERLGYLVFDAESGAKAVSCCRTDMPDLIFLDWHLPDMPAIDLVTEVRSLRAERRTTIIYCATEVDPVDLAKAYAAGIDGHIMKPFDRESLQTKVFELAGEARAVA